MLRPVIYLSVTAYVVSVIALAGGSVAAAILEDRVASLA
jgi:hypothetical protein